uniref:Ankyrin repeat protein n=1 Tax=Panagrolaimus sp. PS1159 TaxID=55785 RepID=A0AC35GEB5_9BILA
MSGKNEKPKHFQSLKEFFEYFDIPLLAENLDEDYTLETLALYSVNELQDNFNISSETAKSIFSKLEQFRKSEAKKQHKGLVSMVTQIFTTPISNQKIQKPKNFINAFESVTGIDFKPADDFPMDPCSTANGAADFFFQHDFQQNFSKYKTFSNSRGWTPLMYASALCRVEIVQSLLTKNPNLCAQNDSKQTALMIAASFGHASILEILINYSKEFSKRIREKYENICGLNLSDENGFTALHFAVYYAHDEAVKCLLYEKANPNVPDKNGMTPTLLACSDQNRQKCLNILIKNGGNMDIRNQKGQNGYDLRNTCYAKAENKSNPQKFNRF